MRRIPRHTLIGLVAVTIVGLGGLAIAGQLPSSQLAPTTDTGVPEGFEEEAWLAASASAAVVDQDEGTDIIILTAEELVPDGIYTIWWVNPGVVGMDMGPGGGLPQNTFTADHEGNAEARLTVDSDNDYEMMVVAYHADHRLYAERPGEMGETTFEHVKGAWPGPAGGTP